MRRVQIKRCAECRMPCKRQFGLDRKDSDFLSFPSFSGSIARRNESRFRKIHLPRQRLHLGVIQSASIGKNRQRITRERRLREYINLGEFVSAARHKETCPRVLEDMQENINSRRAIKRLNAEVLIWVLLQRPRRLKRKTI